jgi:hypothetical protein
MRMWLIGGLVWATAVGAVLYFTPRNGQVLPLPSGSQSAVKPLANRPSAPPSPTTPVTDVVDLNPLLEPKLTAVPSDMMYEDNEYGWVSDAVIVVGRPESVKRAGRSGTPAVFTPPFTPPPEIPTASE